MIQKMKILIMNVNQVGKSHCLNVKSWALAALRILSSNMDEQSEPRDEVVFA